MSFEIPQKKDLWNAKSISNKSLANRNPEINNLMEAINGYEAIVKSERNTERLRNSLTLALQKLSEEEYKIYVKRTTKGVEE